jgi:hypothetical protein
LSQAWFNGRIAPVKGRGTVNKIGLSSVVLGVVMTIGSANAEPLVLSSTDMEQVTAGAADDPQGNRWLDVNVKKDIVSQIKLDILKTITSIVVLFGNVADAEASAQAYGPNTLSETLTIANADFKAGSSDSYSPSIAAATTDVDPPTDLH